MNSFHIRSRRVHMTPKKLENGVFSLTSYQMLSVYENATITGHFGFVFEEYWGREIT